MSVYYSDDQVTLHLGDALEVLRTLPDESVDCVVTSPPYFGLRDYGTPGQYGLEASPAEYVETLRQLFAEVRRVLAGDGTCWVNLGDSYAYPPGSAGRQGNGQRADRRFTAEGLLGTSEVPRKNLIGVPWRVAFALQDDGWVLRNEIIWHKPNAMPESVTDRFSSRHEHLFLFARSARYWFDLDAIREPTGRVARGKTWPERRTAGAPGRHGRRGAAAAKDNDFAVNPSGRNPGDVWSISTRPFPEAHFATMSIDLPIRCIKAGCKPCGTVLDPFSGSGTTGAAARQLGRCYIGIDLNPTYHNLAIKRFSQAVLGDDSDQSGAAAASPTPRQDSQPALDFGDVAL